jgi:3-hydroxyacyl-CoA dehydrogenase
MRIDWVKRILVVGAGTMGHSIAMLFVQGGYKVDSVDTDKQRISRRQVWERIL